MAIFHFDPDAHEDMGNRDLISPGWYLATIVHSDVEQGRTPEQGRVLVVGYQIDANEHPEFARRQIRTWLYTEHVGSPKAAAIANSSLKQICASIDLPKMSDTDQLLGARLQIRVTVQPAKGTYPARNQVEGWRRESAPHAKAPVPESTTTIPAKVAKTSSRPAWK